MTATQYTLKYFLFTVVLAGLVGCGTPPPTNTGYNGSWSHGNQFLTSTIYLWHDGNQYRFRWSRVSTDGSSSVECDWDGNCEEFVDREKTSDYRFRIWEDETTGYLMIHCEGQVHKPKQLLVEYTDELVLAEDGLSLWSYTNSSSGITYEGDRRPKRRLEKISDSVPDPPRAN